MPRITISTVHNYIKPATRTKHWPLSTTTQPTLRSSQPRKFHTTPTTKMPAPLKKSELAASKDPSVAKQYDSTTPPAQQFKDLYAITDALKVCMFSTVRPNLSLPVARSMAISRRVGPDFLFLANSNSQKFTDLDSSRTVELTFQNTSTQDWVSVSGEATTISNDDPRIKELYSPMISAWFGDAGDGVHNGTAEDPRMTLIEVQARHVAYWKKEVTSLGFVKEVVQSAVMGQVAQTGSLRELGREEIEKERREPSG